LPGLLFGKVAGVFVDRLNRKRTMAVANLLQILVMMPLLLVRPGESLWLVYIVAFVLASVWQFVSPAENAPLSGLVGPDRLMVANTLSAFNDKLALMAGPALGGLVVTFARLGRGGPPERGHVPARSRPDLLATFFRYRAKA
jgi:predicted MFS family arabinose efflux permease